jgi:hypothetical protein
VGSASKALASLFVDFQIVGDAFAVRPIAKNQSIRWMVKAIVFHEILQWCECAKVKQPECESLRKRKLRPKRKLYRLRKKTVR